MSLRVTFSNSIIFKVINEYGRGPVVEIESVFRPVYHVACRRVLSNGTFQTFITPRLLESVIWKIHKLWGSPFFWKCSKFNVYLKNLQNNWKTFLLFEITRVWICCVKMPLLRREYLSPAVNVLRNSPKIFPVTKRDPFQLN